MLSNLKGKDYAQLQGNTRAALMQRLNEALTFMANTVQGVIP